jgi:hypothetical protein
VTSPVTFEEAATLPVTAYSGGPGKDHILESGGNGIRAARLRRRRDASTSTSSPAPSCRPSRQRIAHRNALFRNLGGWRFEDVSAKAGVDLPPGGRASAPGTPTATDASISTSPTGAPTRCSATRATARSKDIAPQAGVAAGGWSTGVHVLRRRRGTAISICTSRAT